MPYSKERRLEVLADAEAGMTTRHIALKYNCSESWVRRVKQEFREQGKVAPSNTRKRQPQWKQYQEQIVALIQRTPDMTLQELKDALGTKLTRMTLCNALRALQLTLKKKF